MSLYLAIFNPLPYHFPNNTYWASKRLILAYKNCILAISTIIDTLCFFIKVIKQFFQLNLASRCHLRLYLLVEITLSISIPNTVWPHLRKSKQLIQRLYCVPSRWLPVVFIWAFIYFNLIFLFSVRSS